jgi:TIR domain
MADMHDIDVFFSYDHADRERVRPLVEEVAQRGWAVWWDTDISIGSMWRDVLTDRLDHARAVCVIWTMNSVSSQFVRDEASRAHERGVLVPVRLDPVDQPLGFGEIQYADLSRPGTRADVMRQVISRLERLVEGAAPVDTWQTEISSSARPALYGVDEARRFLTRVRALSDMFAANPGSSAGLRSALAGIRDTYAVVGESIDTFLAPVTEQGSMTLSRYRPLADGRLVTHISRQRGHCKRIAQVYIQSGGLRDSLPASVGADVKHELDDLILMLSNADGDLFDAMASIGVALQNQAAVLINLLLADQEREAKARLRNDEEILLPLRQKVNEGMAEVERLSTELGVTI